VPKGERASLISTTDSKPRSKKRSSRENQTEKVSILHLWLETSFWWFCCFICCLIISHMIGLGNYILQIQVSGCEQVSIQLILLCWNNFFLCVPILFAFNFNHDLLCVRRIQKRLRIRMAAGYYQRHRNRHQRCASRFTISVPPKISCTPHSGCFLSKPSLQCFCRRHFFQLFPSPHAAVSTISFYTCSNTQKQNQAKPQKQWQLRRLLLQLGRFCQHYS